MNQKRKPNGPLASVTAAALLKFLFAFAMTAFGILAAYYTTITGLKLELAGKADGVALAAMDKKITSVEVQLAELFTTKDDFYRLKGEMLERLGKIEAKLERNSGNRCRKISLNFNRKKSPGIRRGFYFKLGSGGGGMPDSNVRWLGYNTSAAPLAQAFFH